MTGDAGDLAALKAAARKAAFVARAAAHAAVGQGAAAGHLRTALAPYAGHVVAAYLPIRTEIDPRPGLAAHDGPLAMPVVIAPAMPLRFRAWTPATPLVPGEFGTQVPGEGAWLVPEVVIVPLLAFDRRGYRLGYGGGFYDRTLAALRAVGPVIAIGLAFAAQEVVAVPVEPTDERLDLIVTEAGAIRPSDPQGAERR